MQRRQQKHAAGIWIYSKIRLRVRRNCTLIFSMQKEFAECRNNKGKKRGDQGTSPLELRRRLDHDSQQDILKHFKKPDRRQERT